MAEHALRSIARMADVLAEKGRIGVKECDGAAVPDDDALIRAINGQRERRFNSLYLLGRFPFVGIVRMDRSCANIMQRISGVYCKVWKILYGTLSRAPILVDANTGVYFKCFDAHSDVVDFFRHSDDMKCTSINDHQGYVFVIDCAGQIIQFRKDLHSLVT